MARKTPVKKAKSQGFRCDVCQKSVEVENGIVQHKPMPHEYKKELAEWEKQHPGPGYPLTEFLSRPSEPHLWQLGHLECFKDINEDYWFPLHEFVTAFHVLHWTAHLGHKVWFDPGDWARLIERHFLYPGPGRVDGRRAEDLAPKAAPTREVR